MPDNVNGRSKSGMSSAALRFMILALLALLALILYLWQRHHTPFVLTGTVTSGTLTCAIDKASNNTEGNCFVLSNGWNKYFSITDYFVGPNVTTNGIPPKILARMRENPDHETNLFLTTCLATNYEQLATGIYVELLSGVTNHCYTNIPTCDCGPSLTTAVFTMSNTTKYEDATYCVILYFKSSTTNPNHLATNICLYWAYTNVTAKLNN
jgi:hypothetical protein